MDSKEALDELEWFINCVGCAVDDGDAYYLKDEVKSASNAYNKLEKDLEVLDIFKRVFNYKSIKKFIEDMSKEEWIKIKEWLENG